MAFRKYLEVWESIETKLRPYVEIRTSASTVLRTCFSNKEIGQRLDLPRQIVSKWRRRFFGLPIMVLPTEANRLSIVWPIGTQMRFKSIRRFMAAGSTKLKFTFRFYNAKCWHLTTLKALLNLKTELSGSSAEYEIISKPFEWKCTPADLKNLHIRLDKE